LPKGERIHHPFAPVAVALAALAAFAAFAAFAAAGCAAAPLRGGARRDTLLREVAIPQREVVISIWEVAISLPLQAAVVGG
jgi:hypothetical protein